jgi:antitoxin (DNA-binding transcriptional repressor) of toxin-antitoxin stability system
MASKRNMDDMGALHISEAELSRNTVSLLDRVRSGTEIVVERNERPPAVLRAVQLPRRKLSEIMASLSPDSTAVLDPDFAADVQAFVDSHREPLVPVD